MHWALQTASMRKQTMQQCYIMYWKTSHKVEYPNNAIYIQDGNALFHSLVSLPSTFGGIYLNILDQMVAKRNFIFSTDSYHPDSIKTQERLRRGQGKKLLLDGPATRTPKNFKPFLTNEHNKKQICELMLKVWTNDSASSQLEKFATGILILEGKAYDLCSSNEHVISEGIHSLFSNQEETDLA